MLISERIRMVYGPNCWECMDEPSQCPCKENCGGCSCPFCRPHGCEKEGSSGLVGILFVLGVIFLIVAFVYVLIRFAP